jgi:hypothetical protein
MKDYKMGRTCNVRIMFVKYIKILVSTREVKRPDIKLGYNVNIDQDIRG